MILKFVPDAGRRRHRVPVLRVVVVLAADLHRDRLRSAGRRRQRQGVPRQRLHRHRQHRRVPLLPRWVGDEEEDFHFPLIRLEPSWPIIHYLRLNTVHSLFDYSDFWSDTIGNLEKCLE